MRALLDVNVLIALLDEAHIHHQLAMDWLTNNIEQGWASCPMTQNGCIRILSQSAYPNTVPAALVAVRLAEACNHSAHTFWADSVSLLELDTIIWKHILGSRQVTDAYLLALAVVNGGCFVTFDKGISLVAVNGAKTEHLVVLGGPLDV
jgi:toxin-antitoxin system PIN domain toxin